MTLVLLSDLPRGVLRVILCLFLISRLLGAQKPGRKTIFAGAAGASALTVLTAVSALPDFYGMALETVWIAVCAGRLQRADRRMGLFVSIFYEIGVSFWQFLFMAGMGVVFRSPAFLDFGTWQGQTAVWLLQILLLAAAGSWSGKRKTEGRDAFRFACGAALAGFIAVITLSEQTTLPIPDDTLTMWTVLSVVLMMAVLVFNMNRQYEVEKELARLKDRQAELLERDYTVLISAYAANAKLFHDFHNHIGALRQLLSHQKYEEAVQYLDELKAPVREMAQTHWTGDETADYLINSKAAMAAEYGIQLQAEVEFPRNANIRSADLCAILGNLLDNALEASRKVPDPGERFVRLTIRRIHQMLVIKVENRFAVLPVEEGGALKTTKTEGGLHGWGLQSVRTAVEKYEGTLQTTCAGDVFRAVATLSFQGQIQE